MKILVTGCAGFIGAAVSQALLQQNHEVIGVDNLNSYYDIKLKEARLNLINRFEHFTFYQFDIKDELALKELFQLHRPKKVIHLAAQAGVRYSLENPKTYLESNLMGFGHILEMCRQFDVAHLVFASSSSVYGNNRKVPFSTTDMTDQPISLYAATKKSNELMAYSYQSLYGFAITGLRYFTVYGPWGRPDMAPFKFVEHILNNKPITVYNNGHHQRDFTYIDDIVAGTLKVAHAFPKEDLKNKFNIYNIGYGQPIDLLSFIQLIEKALNKKAELNFYPPQPGDVANTWADIDNLVDEIGYKPQVSLQEGIPHLVAWYKKYYQIV